MPNRLVVGACMIHNTNTAFPSLWTTNTIVTTGTVQLPCASIPIKRHSGLVTILRTINCTMHTLGGLIIGLYCDDADETITYTIVSGTTRPSQCSFHFYFSFLYKR